MPYVLVRRFNRSLVCNHCSSPIENDLVVTRDETGGRIKKWFHPLCARAVNIEYDVRVPTLALGNKSGKYVLEEIKRNREKIVQALAQRTQHLLDDKTPRFAIVQD